MLIRLMEGDDVEGVARLCGQLGYPTSVAQMSHRLSLLLSDAGKGLFVAQSPDGALIGWIHVRADRVLHYDPFAEICALVVDGDYRGRGIGRALVREAERWALERGYDEIRLRSNADRAATHRFYQQLGYQVVKTSLAFRKLLQA